MKSAVSSVFMRSLSGRRNSDSGGIHGSSMNRTSYRPPVLRERSCFLYRSPNGAASTTTLMPVFFSNSGRFARSTSSL